MDKREAQEVVNETVNGLAGGYIIALMVIAALPVVGWALLIGLAGTIAFPGAAALVVVGLIAWAWLAGVRGQARWKREAAAEEARLARFKEPHGGKDRYFVCDSVGSSYGPYQIRLMSFDRGYGPRLPSYYCAHTYDLGWMHPGTNKSHVDYRVDRDMSNDPKRLAHWQAVFEEWIETGVKPPQDTWWMFPDELAQHEARETERQRALAASVFPMNSLTPAKEIAP